jgi:hypothetical protein
MLQKASEKINMDALVQEDAGTTLQCTKYEGVENKGKATCAASACRRIMFKDGALGQDCSIAAGEQNDGCAAFGQPSCCTLPGGTGSKIICSEGKDFTGAPSASDFSAASCSTECKVQKVAAVDNAASAASSFATTAIVIAIASMVAIVRA